MYYQGLLISVKKEKSALSLCLFVCLNVIASLTSSLLFKIQLQWHLFEWFH